MAAAEQVIREITLRARTEGFEQATRATETLTKVQERAETSVTKYLRQMDAQFRAEMQREAAIKAVVRAHEQGLGATEKVIRLEQQLARVMNDNHKQMGLTRNELLNVSRQMQDVAVSLAGGQSPFTVLAQQGSQLYDVLATHKGGVGSALRSLGETMLGLVTPARLFGVGVVGSLVAIEMAASRAQTTLSGLGAQASRSGVSASGILHAQRVGAGAGLSDEESNSALASASKQFEQFKRNGGDVLEFMKKFDASFIPVLDKARSLGDFVRLVGEEAKRLGGERDLDLTQRLLGEDQGRALVDRVGEFFNTIDRGAGSIDAAAKSAYDLQKQVAEAGKIADDKLLAAFADLKTFSADISMAWISIKSAIADAAGAAGRAYQYLRGFIPDWTSPTGFLGGGEANRVTLPDISVGGAAGASRRGYAAASPAKGGSRSASSEADRYSNIVRDMEQQLRLAQAIGDEHKRIQNEIEKENWLEKLGKDHAAEHVKHVGELADKIIRAREEQEKMTEAAKGMAEAYSSVAHGLSGGIKDIIHGGKPGDALKKGLDSFGDNMLDAALTGSGPMAKMMGFSGKDGAVGGLFGKLGEMLFPGGDKKTQTMNVTAATVNVSGDVGKGLGSLAEGAGGLLSWFSKLWPFEDGGIMTSAGPVPLHRYAAGGVANSPQLALFGEGRGPEAFVPLPDGRSIPVSMQGGGGGAKVTVNNLLGGSVRIEPEVTHDGVLITVRREIAANNARLPGMMGEMEKRRL
jgi:hypothetical protein